MGIIETYTEKYWEIVQKKFLQKIEKQDNTCWVWKGYKNNAGYGLVHIPTIRKQEYAHRLSYELFNQAIDENNVIMHTCDNPSCVNPEHLIQGTQQENMLDKNAKGRGHYPGMKNSLNGRNNPAAKLDNIDIEKIRKIYKSGNTSYSQLAKQFNISKSQIFRIVKGHSWIKS